MDVMSVNCPLKKILSPTLKGLLVITIKPAMALPTVFMAAKPIIVPPKMVRIPEMTPVSTLHCARTAEKTNLSRLERTQSPRALM